TAPRDARAGRRRSAPPAAAAPGRCPGAQRAAPSPPREARPPAPASASRAGAAAGSRLAEQALEVAEEQPTDVTAMGARVFGRTQQGGGHEGAQTDPLERLGSALSPPTAPPGLGRRQSRRRNRGCYPVL